ncbi:MAG: L-threonylcarbamoyladenylate synthase [Candidatus Micrarchaeia archaeon]|jgi:L-threonylcarbamoyladenylate synthase
MAARKTAKKTSAILLPPGFHCPIISVRDPAAPRKAAAVMALGGIVAYPTETAYALGCSGLDKGAVVRVYAIKARDRSKPLPLIMADARMVSKFTVSTPGQKRLVEKFMPGPLTIAAKKRVAIPASGKAETVAFRIPASEFARKASRLFGAPIVSTSANLSGEAAVYEIGQVVELFARKADLIVDGGNLPQVPASTIVCLLGAPKILREGPIGSKEVLAEASGTAGGMKAAKKKTRSNEKKKSSPKGRKK